MNEDFRNRVVTPILLPVAVIAGIGVFTFSLSRVFLAIPSIAATIIALLIAAYVLGLGALIAARRHLNARSVGVGMAIGLLAVVGAGAAAWNVGPREITPPTLEEADGEEEVNGADQPDEDVETEIPDDALVFVTEDNVYTEAPDTAPSGTVTFAIVNEGAADHNVVIEELGDELVVEAPGGAVEVGEVDLDPGEEYTYYCSIPGHRATMEGTLTTED